MKIYDAIMNSDSDASGTVLVLDISDSTKMKEDMDESSWLVNYAKAFDCIISCVPEQAEVVKYLGDGIMIFFLDDEHTLAINSAIRMQEALLHAFDDNKIRCAMSAGIASGSLKKIPISEKKFDYLGSVVDRAFRLCSAANPRAIFVDADTVISANMSKVISEIGKVLGRDSSEYAGEPGKLQLKGFSKLVKFHEIYWSKDRYGIKSSYESLNSPRERADKRDIRPTKVDVDKTAVSLLGKFTGWIGNGNVGRVATADGVEYFCHKGSVLEGFELNGGEEVFFVKETMDGKPLDHANNIVPLGVSLSGSIINVVGNNGFVQCPILASHGHENLYTWLGETEGEVRPNDLCKFTLSKGFSRPKQRYTPNATNLVLLEADE